MKPALLLLAAALPARAEIVDIAWDAAGRFERTLAVAPGKFAEACGALAAGSTVRWRFEAGAPLDFNIHYHVGKAVEYPAKQAAVAKAGGTLDAKRGEDYCWMWTNKGSAPATLSFTLER